MISLKCHVQARKSALIAHIQSVILIILLELMGKWKFVHGDYLWE